MQPITHEGFTAAGEVTTGKWKMAVGRERTQRRERFPAVAAGGAPRLASGRAERAEDQENGKLRRWRAES